MAEQIPFTDIRTLFIGGELVATTARAPVLNPATEDVIGEAPVASVADAQAAVTAARDAFDSGPWPSLSRRERGAILLRLHDLLLAEEEPMTRLLVAEAGATLSLARAHQFRRPLRILADEIERNRVEPARMIDLSINPGVGGAKDVLSTGMVFRDPVGVVAGIASFNFPFRVSLSKLIPSLLAGNTLVLKPSPYTPFSTLMLGDLARKAGIPKGVLNIINGEADVGSIITSDPRVDLVTFTGSERVGAAISAAAAPTIKRLLLELGGKSALIVRKDADIKRAALVGLLNTVIQAGQACARASRHLVHNDIRPAYVEALKTAVTNIRVGNPIEPTTSMGPVIREVQRREIERMVAIGRDEGARLIAGGRRPPHLPRGFFFEPTVFDDVDNAMSIAQEEIFGPVTAVIGFDTDDEAVRIANASRYGLAGWIETADPAKGLEMARRIRTGGIDINGGGPNDNAPLGGVKRSGIGREYGPHWLDEYTAEKTVFLPAGFGRPS